MPHALEVKYGLTSSELLDAIDRRFRLKVALEGAVAEVHFERKLKVGSQEGWIGSFEDHDVDGMHDFTFTTLSGQPIRVEVKTVRGGNRYVVEIQKTRNAKDDPSSRYYDATHFDVIAVCIGRKTGNWSEFRYALVDELPHHPKFPQKLKVMHEVRDEIGTNPRWFSRLQEVIDELER
jgi:hypothetical protein